MWRICDRFKIGLRPLFLPIWRICANYLIVSLIVAAIEEGKATNVSSGNIATGGKIREVNSTLNLVKAEINLP